MADKPYVLWCIITGDPVPFRVVTPSDVDIDALKGLIHESCKNRILRGVDPKDLTLVKVNVDFETHGDEIHSGKYKPITYDRIKEWSSVAEVWPDRPPSRRLHIFVIPPRATFSIPRRYSNSLGFRSYGNDSSSHNTRSSPGGQQRQRSAFDDPAMQKTLEDAGYVLIPELSDDPIENPLGFKPVTPLKPTIRRATSANGVEVILKLLDGDTDELTFLRYLKKNNSVANHVIDLMGVLDLSVGTVVSFPAGTRLDEGLRFGSFPDAVGSLRIQFLEGVAFLHEHKIAHLDLNPNNVIVGGVRSPSRRLSIIDFGLSMFVEDENTVTRGYCGTRGWVAPEVGTLDGPTTTYSAIRADRWACGRMIDYFGKYIRDEDSSQDTDMGQWSARLQSEDPRMRPSLREVLSGHRTAADGGPKRRIEVDGSDLAQKCAKVSSTQGPTQAVGHINYRQQAPPAWHSIAIMAN